MRKHKYPKKLIIESNALNLDAPYFQYKRNNKSELLSKINGITILKVVIGTTLVLFLIELLNK